MSLMPVSKPSPRTARSKDPAPKRLLEGKTFAAVLQRTPDRPALGDGAAFLLTPLNLWGKRGRIRVSGRRSTAFAFGDHSLSRRAAAATSCIVNNKMLAGGKSCACDRRSEVSSYSRTLAPRVRCFSAHDRAAAPAKGQSKRLLKFFESLNPSRRNDIAKWVAEPKGEDSRRRRARQIAERLMETMEAERELPPTSCNWLSARIPCAAEQWQRMSPSHRARSSIWNLLLPHS